MKFNNLPYATYKTETEINTITLSEYIGDQVRFSYHQHNTVTGEELFSDHDVDLQTTDEGLEFVDIFGVRVFADANVQTGESNVAATLDEHENIEPTKGYGDWDSYKWNQYWGQMWEYNRGDEGRMQAAVNKFNEFTFAVQSRIINHGVETLHAYVINK